MSNLVLVYREPFVTQTLDLGSNKILIGQTLKFLLAKLLFQLSTKINHYQPKILPLSPLHYLKSTANLNGS